MNRSDDSTSGQITGLLSPFLERLRNRKLADQIADRTTLLDVGCGRGALLARLRRQGKQRIDYMGVDIDAACIAANRERYPTGRFEVADAWEFCREPRPTFDVIVLGAMVEHIDDPMRFLGTYRQCLKPGGKFILTTPRRGAEGILAVGSCLGIFSREAHEEHQDVLLDRRDLERIANGIGMRMSLYRRFLFGLNQLAVFDHI